MAAETATEVAIQQSGISSDVMVFSVLALIVASISLYEFFTSIHWQQVTSSNRNDIVFEEKNKNYGAYQIRRDYNKNLLLIILGLILLIGLSYGGKMVYDKFSVNTEEDEREIINTAIIDYYDDTIEDEVIPEPEPEIEEIVQLEDQTAFFPPVVTDDQVDTPPPTVTELDNSKVGKEDVIGNTDYTIKDVPPPPPVVKTTPVIETVVDEMAEFPGGRRALVKFLVENIQYPDIARELGLSGKAVLKFVVNTDGTIKTVSVVRGMKDCKECDNEAVRVVRKMPRWAPAKKGGKTVPSYFILPVEFSLE